ncbi:uncharacterized protein DUF4230 [Tenacibaculum skagerrakense]|uniref:Uncharacterized protein DUF4230 n=1 Tax=Tenacibaculum skagerrakense TaxID=186571 RepID=A0A4R2NU14_9FLAO|nr:DUF4230 domain-containing protein [Tenacibaculum skagerrakense]TCP24984.1 uncharacterized protein DUF4230 [Tenacibaculum skagerrakense]
MIRFIKYLAVFLLGFLIAKFWCDRQQPKYQTEEVKVMVNEIKNLSKLVVSQGNYSEMYSFSDTRKYFFDYLQFQKKAIVSVNAKVEVGYDLSKLDIQIDSLNREIIINKVPEEEVIISPDVKYFDLKQSQFNTFSKEELNTVNAKAIERIKETIELTNQKKEAKTRLFEELSKIYQLSKIYNWKVVDNTEQHLIEINFFKD